MIKVIDEFVSFKNYIYFYVFLLPFTYFGSQLGIATGILIIWWLYELKKDSIYIIKLKEMISFEPIMFMIVFLIFVALSYFWSENKYEYSKVLNTHKYFFFIIPIIFTSLNKEEALKSLKLLALSFGIYGLFSLLIYLNIFTWEGSSSSNPKFLFRYMITGIYLTLGSLLLYYYFLKSKNKEKIFLTILFLVSLVGVFINNGRAAQVALVFTCLLMIIFNFRKIKFDLKKVISFLILGVILIVVISTNKPLINKYKNVIHQLKTYDSEKNYRTSTGQRIKMYSIGIDIYKKEPFLGVGAGDFKMLFHKYIKDNNVKVGWIYNTNHNVYIEYLIKYGILGFLLFLFPFISLFISFRKSEYFNLYLLTIPPLLVVFMFDSILVYKPFNNVFIMIFTLLCVIGYYEEKTIKIE